MFDGCLLANRSDLNPTVSGLCAGSHLDSWRLPDLGSQSLFVGICLQCRRGIGSFKGPR